MLKKVLALTLTLALCLSLSAVTLVANAAEFDGEADLKVPLYTVVVPNDFSDMVFIDPIEIGKGGQLYCGEDGFVFANQTPVPIFVNVDVTMTAAATSGITLVADPEEVTTGLNPPADEKNIYLGIEAPLSMAASSGVTDPALAETDIKSTFGDADTRVVVPFEIEDPQTANASFSLVLNAGVDAEDDDDQGIGSDNYATDNDSLGAFKFYADLTTYNSTWAKKDLVFEGTFEFQGLRDNDYADAVGAKVTDSHNLYLSGPTEVGFYAKSGTGLTIMTDTSSIPSYAQSAESHAAITVSKGPGAVIPFFADGKTIDMFSWWNGGNPTALDTTSTYSDTDHAFTVDFSDWPVGGPYDIWVEVEGEYYVVWVTIE